MNLIEQLGGYDLAKQVFDSIPKDGNSYSITRDDTGASFKSGEIYKALLEYRRQHNIFEVGDFIIYDEFRSVGKFSKHVGKQKELCCIDYGLGELAALIKYLRHATDAEIKARRRLT